MVAHGRETDDERSIRPVRPPSPATSLDRELRGGRGDARPTRRCAVGQGWVTGGGMLAASSPDPACPGGLAAPWDRWPRVGTCRGRSGTSSSRPGKERPPWQPSAFATSSATSTPRLTSTASCSTSTWSCTKCLVRDALAGGSPAGAQRPRRGPGGGQATPDGSYPNRVAGIASSSRLLISQPPWRRCAPGKPPSAAISSSASASNRLWSTTPPATRSRLMSRRSPRRDRRHRRKAGLRGRAWIRCVRAMPYDYPRHPGSQTPARSARDRIAIGSCDAGRQGSTYTNGAYPMTRSQDSPRTPCRYARTIRGSARNSAAGPSRPRLLTDVGTVLGRA